MLTKSKQFSQTVVHTSIHHSLCSTIRIKMRLLAVSAFAILLICVANGASSDEHRFGLSQERDQNEQSPKDYDEYDDDDGIIFSIVKVTKITISFIGDTLLILIQPIYFIFVSSEKAQNNTLSIGNNTNYSLTKLTNENYETNFNTNSSNNESTTEYSELLLEMLPQLLSVFDDNEVEIMAPNDERILPEELTSTTVTTTSTTTPTPPTTTPTPSPSPLPLENTKDIEVKEEEEEEEKGFFATVVGIFSDFLG